ncbi:hypothetical protein [Nocardioides allogilvus]|uniref:hypothetical protein n=1 Tax=Nocardioides allogilvus TaxID=2072017 RepID=UPI0013004995|nr:hypothetical protein [Nocardioides allogilvus]
MTPQHNVVLRGGVADGQTLHCSHVGSPVEWEDVGGGALTYVGTEETETINGTTVTVYRLAH